MFGLRETIDMDDVKAWRKEAKRLNDPSLANYDPEHHPTELYPSNVDRGDIIRRVLKCHPPGLGSGFRVPAEDLLASYLIVEPSDSFERIWDLAGDICVGLTNEINRSRKPKEPPEDSEEEKKLNG